ncbi:MAG: TrkA family potassium uptake protein [Muribaculaceae bacterium]|nr:TrkA family potassium uptake protein [Muribaculaceae bacterium]
MRCIVIGLGIYGENLARDLTEMGNEVIGVDFNKNHVDAIKDNISTVYHLDSTEETALAALPLNNVDVVIVAIGENFGASIKTVALLKKAGVKHIYARAIDKLHEAILQSFEIDAILTPEQRAAEELASELEFGCTMTTMPVDDETVVAKITAPAGLVGQMYADLDMTQHFDLMLVAAARPRMRRNVLGIERPSHALIDLSDGTKEKVEANDILTIFGRRKKIRDFYKSYTEAGK